MVFGCSTVKVTSDYDAGVDFSEMQTYAWLDIATKPGDDVRINNELVKKAVRKAVEKVLHTKGYVKAAGEEADFQITWLGAIDKKIQSDNVSHFYQTYGYGALQRDPQWSKESNLSSREYEEGTLIIDFLDPVKHRPIWRGAGSEKISGDGTEEEAKRKINRVVAQILQKFPPEKK